MKSQLKGCMETIPVWMKKYTYQKYYQTICSMKKNLMMTYHLFQRITLVDKIPFFGSEVKVNGVTTMWTDSLQKAEAVYKDKHSRGVIQLWKHNMDLKTLKASRKFYGFKLEDRANI